MLKRTLIASLILIPLAFVFAQSDGTAPSSGAASTTSATTTLAQAPAVASSSVATPRPTPGTQVVRTSTKIIATPPKITAPTIPSTTPAPTTPVVDAPQTNTDFTTLVIVAIASLLAAIGVWQFKKSKNVQEKDDGRCDTIKQLIDQKKKELEDMARDWPQEKLKEMAQEKILDTLEHNTDAKTVVTVTEAAKEKYDKLTKVIALLEKRYDLCMLSFPEKSSPSYEGTIAENSLTDKAILENIKITKKYNSRELSLNDVLVNENQINKLGEYLDNGPWHIYFQQSGKDDGIVVFKDKIFRVKHSDKKTWHEAAEYGKSKGIPEDRLIF